MADSGIWLLVRWEREGKRYRFLVRSVRTRKTKEFLSEFMANAEVLHEDKLDAAERHASKLALVLDAQPMTDEVTPGEECLYQVRLSDDVPMYFGADAEGNLVTSISLDPAVIKALLSETQPSSDAPIKP